MPPGHTNTWFKGQRDLGGRKEQTVGVSKDSGAVLKRGLAEVWAKPHARWSWPVLCVLGEESPVLGEQLGHLLGWQPAQQMELEEVGWMSYLNGNTSLEQGVCLPQVEGSAKPWDGVRVQVLIRWSGETRVSQGHHLGTLLVVLGLMVVLSSWSIFFH